MPDTIRCFLALKIPADTAIRRVLKELAAMGRALKAVEPENLHVTLKFLAAAEPESIPEIAAIATDAVGKHAHGQLNLTGLGVFPHAERPNVIWAGLAGPGAADAVHNRRGPRSGARTNRLRAGEPAVRAPLDAGPRQIPTARRATSAIGPPRQDGLRNGHDRRDRADSARSPGPRVRDTPCSSTFRWARTRINVRETDEPFSSWPRRPAAGPDKSRSAARRPI